MKTIKLSIFKVVIAALLFTFTFSQNLQAQDESSPIYIEIAKVKKMNDDFINVENEIIKPYVQERIKQGNQLAHVLLRVHYPASDDAAYDYVMMSFFKNFEDVNLGNEKFTKIAHQTFPNANLPRMIERYEASIHLAEAEVFQIEAEAVPGPGGGEGSTAKFIQVNSMKVAPSNGDTYAEMEKEIFMPIHQELIKAGKMHDWILASRVFPYGSDWENTFLTFDIFNQWGDMEPGNMGGLFSKVHPDKKIDNVWEKMMNLREMTRSETWEIINVVNQPTPEIISEVIKEGTGASPMKGQEVTYKSSLTDLQGKTIFSSEMLGFNFHSTVGENVYDTFFDKHLQKMKKGGIMKMKVPGDAQDKTIKGMTGGKTAYVEVELIEIGTAKPNGSKLLKKKIDKHGLAVAKEKYKKLQTANPKGYVFREDAMNILGYELLQKGNTDAAIYIFELNTKRNPKSWNACDSLADGYRAAGNVARAKHCYEMAIKINPNFQAAKDKLSKL